MSDFLQPHGLNSPGQNTGVGSLSLLQGLNPGLPHCTQILYQLSHREKNPIKNVKANVAKIRTIGENR